MKRIQRLFSPVVPFLAALAVVSCADHAREAVSVQSAAAATGRLVQHVELSGVLASSATVNVSSKLAGQAQAVNVDVGSRVRKGDILIEIDTRELEARLAVAEAAVQQVQDQAAQARLAIDAARANLDLAQKSYDRAAALMATQSIPQGQLDDAQAKLEVARAAYGNAAEQYQLLTSSSLAQARAQANLVRVQIGDGRIASPIRGIVTNRNVNPGEVVGVSSPLLTVVDPSVLKLQGNVEQAIATLLVPGTRVRIRVDGMRAGDYDGVISQVGPVAASTGQFFPVIVSVKNDGRLMAGMTAVAAFDLPGPPSLLVPRAAVMASNGKAYVFVLSGGTLSRRAVSIGLESSTAVEVLRGLSAGERVAASSVDALQDGMAVKPGEVLP